MPNRLMVVSVAACCVVLATGCDRGAAAAAPSTSTGTVAKILDGDTLDVRQDDGTKIRVRLLGIDAPEVAHEADGTDSQCGAAAAHQRLAQLTKGRRVEIVADSRAEAVDQYGRRLGYVQLDGVDVGRQIVDEGMAGAWKPKSAVTPDRWAAYVAAAAAARREHRGSWATCAEVGRAT